jgi:hypothetical protein
MTARRWALLCVCVLLAACGSDGRTLRSPESGASAPPVQRSTTTPAGQAANTGAPGSATAFTVTSSAFEPGAPIPVVYTCDGNSVSPPLAWGSVPSGTVELALTVVDPDANNFIHWAMAGIDPSVQAIGEGSVPDGVAQAKNSTNSTGWTGPCPPKGDPPHHYVFTLYALSAPSGLTDATDGRAAINTITQHKIAAATLVGTYQRAS